MLPVDGGLHPLKKKAILVYIMEPISDPSQTSEADKER